MIRSRALSAALLALCIPTVAGSQSRRNDSRGPCGAADFATNAVSRLRLAVVTGAPRSRVYFVENDGDCPSGAARCRSRRHVAAGQRVLVARSSGDWSCAWRRSYGRDDDPDAGWLPTARLRIVEPDRAPALERWLGLWGFFDNYVEITRVATRGQRGLLSVKGEAYWYGAGDNVHFGEVSGRVRPTGNRLVIDGPDCRMRLWLLDDFVVVRDNGRCGGVNVRFDGVYHRDRWAPGQR